MECAIREAFEETGMHLRNEPEAGGCPCAFCYRPCRHVLTDESRSTGSGMADHRHLT